jgi:hypothetical protein
MAVPRVEWECPECGRRYAIRADMPTPATCPQCVPAAAFAEEPEGGISSGEAATADVQPRSKIAAEGIHPRASGAGRIRVSDHAPRYRALRLLSVILRVLAALTLVAAVAALTLMVLAALRNQNADLRTAAILTHLATFGGTLLMAVLLWGAAEMIHLLIDIEANTRRR